MSLLLFALRLEPDDVDLIPPSPFSDGDHLILFAFIAVVAAVFGFEMLRTWRNTTEWRREARRRRRELQ